MIKNLIHTALAFTLAASILLGQDAKPIAPQSSSLKLALDSATGIEAVNGQVKAVDYRGRRAVQLVPLAGKEASDDSILGILTGTDFANGVIELEVSGAPRKGAAENMKGFIGVAFRIQDKDKGPNFEMFYVRPSNAR